METSIFFLTTNFFSHENQAALPAFSHGNGLRSGTKSDLLQCFEVFGASQQQQKLTPEVDAILLDGAAVVQMLNPDTATTFQDYADSVFGRFVSSQIAKASRVDVVWDAYLPGSLKATIRKKRGKGVRG